MRIVVKERETGVIIVDRRFDDEAVYVGSQPGCSVCLPDLRIGAHCLLICPDEQGVWCVEPLNADVPLKIGDQDLTARRMLVEGDQIDLFEHVMTVYVLESAEDRQAEEERLSPTDLAEIKKYPLPPGSFIKKTGDPIQLDPGQMMRISRATLEIAEARDVHQLVEVALTHLLQGFRGRCAWIGLRRQPSGDLEAVGGRYASGEACDEPSLATGLRHRCLDRTQSILVRRAEDSVIGSAVATPIMPPSGGTYGIVYVDVRKGAKRLGTADLDALQVMAAVLAHRLEALLTGLHRQQAVVSNAELAVLQRMQEQLDPQSVPTWKELQIAAFSRAGQEHSGDVYDVMRVPGKELGYLFLAHVQADGPLLPALMAQVHASFRMACVNGTLPHAFFRQLNYVLYGERETRYAGCFGMIVDPSSGQIRHCRAGRIGAIIIDDRGQPRPFGAIGMPAVGAERAFEYTISEDTLRPGETLALYTSGAVVATNAAGERFREKRLIECICDSFGQPATVMLDDLKADITAFTDGGTHLEDMTVLLVYRPEM
jgi:serine phosphatase RsbU (regulator of sigma subunit)